MTPHGRATPRWRRHPRARLRSCRFRRRGLIACHLMMNLTKRIDFNNLSADQLREVRWAVLSAPTSAHTVAICLRQLDEYARELQNSAIWTREIAAKGIYFRDLVASEEIRNLRDVVEHSVEYLAGGGRKPTLIHDPEADWPSVQVIDGKATVITVFGRAYQVKPTILAAIAFARALAHQAAA